MFSSLSVLKVKLSMFKNKCEFRTMFSRLPQIVTVLRMPHYLVEQGSHPMHGKD